MFGMEKNPKMLIRSYEVGRLLGQGTFAKVYHAKNTKTNQGVAIKVIDKGRVMKGELIKQIKREISVMRLVRHPNIVQLYEVMATKSKIYFVVEYVKGGELFDKVAKGKLKEDVARKYFSQLINAVDFCHSRGVYHRDIKLENLLLDEHDNLKVSDFGLSAIVESEHEDQLLHTTCGTPAYVAPEVINRQAYDGVKADIWSCGVVLFVLLAGYLPFHDLNLMELYRKIGKGEFKYPKGLPSDVRRLLSRMLDPNPHSRISMAKIKESSWFKKGLNNPKTIEIDNVMDTKQELVKPPCMTAFDIISLSAGFDLSRLFEESPQNKVTRFISTQPVETIISKMEEIATTSGLKVTKQDAGSLKFEEVKEGRNRILSMDAEIYEVAPMFHMVEVKKNNRDTSKYDNLFEEVITAS